MKDGAKIDRTTRVARADNVFFSEIDDEVVMMNADLDSYCGIDPVGSRIWTLIEQPIAVSVLCDILREEFEVAADVCEREVIAFLEQLEDEGLAKKVDQPDDATG